MSEKRKIDYKKLKESSNILVLNELKIISVEFLDEGYITDHIFDDGKKTDKYVYRVKDLKANNEEKEFSTLSRPLVIKIGEFSPIKNKRLNISKFRTGTSDFDIDYRVSEV